MPAEGAPFEGFETRRVETSGATIHARIGGRGPPLLLLHGYPQSHLMWRRIAPALAAHFTVVAADLRGYGDSAKPPGGADHAAYAKRAMAQDQVEAMAALGFPRFQLVGHDRGGRVAHRLALDHPQALTRLAVLDIAPTATMYAATDRRFATAYYHWFFLIQPFDLPERLIGGDPDYYIERILGGWGRRGGAIEETVLAEYKRCFRDPAAIHASCEDYRAAAGIDLEHDRASRAAGRKVACPLLVLWGDKGKVGRFDDPLALWNQYASGPITGGPVDTTHYLAEEDPAAIAAWLLRFFR